MRRGGDEPFRSDGRSSRPTRGQPPTEPPSGSPSRPARTSSWSPATGGSSPARPRHPNQDAGHRAAVADGQHPFAVIVGCSDSRLAAEIIFDRGLGDLFVVRTAGHTAGPEVLGSVEYAVTVLGTPLVVVLGHDSCGAVQAAREAVAHRRRTRRAPGRGGRRRAAQPAPRRPARGWTTSTASSTSTSRRPSRRCSGSRPCSPTRWPPGRCAVVGMSYRLAAGEVRPVAAVPAGVAARDVPSAGPAGARRLIRTRRDEGRRRDAGRPSTRAVRAVRAATCGRGRCGSTARCTTSSRSPGTRSAGSRSRSRCPAGRRCGSGTRPRCCRTCGCRCCATG